jgi:hypothetical protein
MTLIKKFRIMFCNNRFNISFILLIKITSKLKTYVKQKISQHFRVYYFLNG